MTHRAVDPCFVGLELGRGAEYFLRSRLILESAKANNITLTSEKVGAFMEAQAKALQFVPPVSRA